MRTYELDECGFELVGKVNNEAVLVATYVENGSIVSDKSTLVPNAFFKSAGSFQSPLETISYQVPRGVSA